MTLCWHICTHSHKHTEKHTRTSRDYRKFHLINSIEWNLFFVRYCSKNTKQPEVLWFLAVFEFSKRIDRTKVNCAMQRMLVQWKKEKHWMQCMPYLNMFMFRMHSMDIMGGFLMNVGWFYDYCVKFHSLWGKENNDTLQNDAFSLIVWILDSV